MPREIVLNYATFYVNSHDEHRVIFKYRKVILTIRVSEKRSESYCVQEIEFQSIFSQTKSPRRGGASHDWLDLQVVVMNFYIIHYPELHISIVDAWIHIKLMQSHDRVPFIMVIRCITCKIMIL